MRRKASVAVLVLVALVGAACGGDDSGSSAGEAEESSATVATDEDETSPDDTDPPADDDGDDSSGATSCSLLTEADLTALGLVVTSGPTENTLASSDECGFELAPDGDPPIPGRVSIVLYTPSEAQALSAELYSATLLEDLGKEAWYAPGTGLQVRLEDDRVISIQVLATQDGDTQENLVALGKAAVARA